LFHGSVGIVVFMTFQSKSAAIPDGIEYS
jgi:hypothetical protein